MIGSFPSSRWLVVIAGTVVLLGFFSFSALACQDVPSPVEFEVYLPAESQLLPNGMMVVKYRDSAAEHRTHITIHRVVMVMPGRHPSLPELRDPQFKVLETDGTIGPMTYLIKAHALYYGVGIDSLGFPEKSWIDPEEDGLNGNEHLTYMPG